MQFDFAHERLDCYRLAVEVNRWFGEAVFPPGRAHLKDQGQRASDSIVCNIAEGASKRGSAAGRGQPAYRPGRSRRVLRGARPGRSSGQR